MISLTHQKNGLFLEERHPVDEALGCMVPISAIALSLAALLIF